MDIQQFLAEIFVPALPDFVVACLPVCSSIGRSGIRRLLFSDASVEYEQSDIVLSNSEFVATLGVWCIGTASLLLSLLLKHRQELWLAEVGILLVGFAVAFKLWDYGPQGYRMHISSWFKKTAELGPVLLIGARIGIDWYEKVNALAPPTSCSGS